MWEINQNPEIRVRKNILYRGSEIKALGFKTREEMPPAIKSNFDKLIIKNLNYAYWIPEKNQGDPDAVPFKSTSDNIEGMFVDKGKCENVFEFVSVDGLNMYEKRSNIFKMKNKFNRKVIDSRLANIKFLINCSELTDVFFIKFSLERIQLVREKFVLELE